MRESKMPKKPLKDEHMEVLKSADAALEQADKNLQEGRERLKNAIKKYEERGRVGFSKHI